MNSIKNADLESVNSDENGYNPSYLDLLRENCDEIFNLSQNTNTIYKSEVVKYKTFIEKLNNKKINSLDDFLLQELVQYTDKDIKKTQIKLLLDYLNETAIAAFGTPHDFHTKNYTRKLYENCKVVYIEKLLNEGKMDKKDVIDFISEIEKTIVSAYNVENTEKLSQIWIHANSEIILYINKKYKIQIPDVFLYETVRMNDEDVEEETSKMKDVEEETGSMDVALKNSDDNDNDEKDGRIEKVLKKLNKKSSDGIYLGIDTANTAMLKEFSDSGGKGIQLKDTVAIIDAAKQPSMDDKFYQQFDTLKTKSVCIGDICFSLRDQINIPVLCKNCPIQISIKNDENDYKPIMYCQKEAGVTILTNLLQDFEKDSNNFKGRSKTQAKKFECYLLPNFCNKTNIPIKLDEKHINSLDIQTQEKLILILLKCKAAGDFCPMVFLKYLQETDPLNTYWFMTGDKLAAIACKNLTAYNRPNGRTDFYIPPFEFANPDIEIIRKLFILKHSLDKFRKEDFQDNHYDFIAKIESNIKNLYDIKDPRKSSSFMAIYMIQLLDSYNERIKNIEGTVNALYSKINMFINSDIDSGNIDIDSGKTLQKEFIDEVRSKIPSLTLTATELENVLYSKIDDTHLGYNRNFEKVYHEMPRKQIIRENIDRNSIPNAINNFDNGSLGEKIKKNELFEKYDDKKIFLKIGIYNHIVEDKNRNKTETLYDIIQIEEKGKKKNIILKQIACKQTEFKSVNSDDKNAKKNDKIPSDPKELIREESIIGGLPETYEKKKNNIISREIPVEVFREVLDQYTIIDLLDYILIWPNNRFIIPEQPTRPGRAYDDSMRNTKKFYKHIMAALYFLIEDIGVIEHDKDETIQQDVLEILLNFVSNIIPYYKDQEKFNKLIEFLNNLFDNESNTNFKIFEIEFSKSTFDEKIKKIKKNREIQEKRENQGTNINAVVYDSQDNGSSYVPSDDDYDSDASSLKNNANKSFVGFNLDMTEEQKKIYRNPNYRNPKRLNPVLDNNQSNPQTNQNLFSQQNNSPPQPPYHIQKKTKKDNKTEEMDIGGNTKHNILKKNKNTQKYIEKTNKKTKRRKNKKVSKKKSIKSKKSKTRKYRRKRLY
jgi:hypothetical protein